MEHSSSEKLTVPQMIKKLAAFLGNQKLITMFTTASYLSLIPINSVHILPTYFCKIHFNSILWSLFFRDFYQNPHSCHILFPSYPSWFVRPNNIWSGIKIMKLLGMQFKFLQIIVITRCSETLTDVYQNIQQTRIIKGENIFKEKIW